MLNKFILSNIFLLLFSCHTTVGKKNEKIVNNDLRTRLYYRDVGCNNQKCSYFDNIVIENFEMNRYKLSQLTEYVKKYLDTVKADLPIEGFVFLRESKGEKLQQGFSHKYHEFAEFQLCGIFFEPGTKEINSISFYKNNEFIDYALSVKELLKRDTIIN